MKRLLLLIFMTVSAVLTFAADHKYSFENLGIFYNITSSSDLTVEVTYGKQYGEYFGVVDIPQTTSYNGVYYTVTSVGKHAFSACSGLTKVIFPETVTKIGDYAFSGCNAMMEMVIPTTITSIGNYAFNSCSRLSNIEFVYDSTPLSLGSGSSKGASYGLFYDCPLESITITRPLSYSTLKSNGYSPFAYHPTLKSAVFKNWINTGNYIFCGCDALTSVTLPDFMVTINDYSFYGCKSLKSIDIPDKVTSLGNSAFRNCRFTTFTLGSGVESIADYCFAECISLKSFTFPVNLTKVGNYAFSGCTAVKELLFEYGSNKNLEIGYGASKGSSYSIFYDCPLESVVLGRGLNYSTSKNNGYSPFANHPTLTSFTFDHIVNTGKYMLYGCGFLTSVNLGTLMVTINDYAFANCKSLSTIDIPATVTTIGNSAFRNCNWFTSFKIGTGVETIGDYCFAGCISLDDFTIPGNVTKIGNYAFSDCTRIKNVSIEKGSTALSFGYGASKGDNYGLFYDCPLESVTICRGLSYNTSKNYGYSPFAYNSTLMTVNYDDGAKGVANYLFCGDAALSSVTMTRDMVAIGNYSFYGCVGIKSFVIGTKNGDKIESSVETIGDYAFSDCKNLTGLIFPPSITSIGNYAFRNCSSFNNFAIEEGTETLSLGNGSSEGEKTGLFRDCPLTTVFIGRNLSYNYAPLSYITTLTEIKIGNPVKRIPNYIFQGDTELITLHFNQSCILSAIGKYAFAGCSKLPPHKFPETVTSIEEGAFQNCTSFKSFEIGDNVETIGAYAFDGCNQLTGLILHPALKSIGNYAFRNCSAMNNLTIEESSESLTYGNGTSEGEKIPLFKDCPLKSIFIGRNFKYSEKPPFAGNVNLTDVRFGNPVTRIPNWCFSEDTELINIEFNHNSELKSIGEYAFNGCIKLSSVTFPETVTTYEKGAFQGCTGFTSFTIPATVTNIGDHVFNKCTGLTKLELEDGTETLTLGYGSDSGDKDKAGKGLFYDCPLNSVYVGRPLSYNSYTRYGHSPFAFITSLKDFQMGEAVVTIGSQHLRGCTGIESLVIPNKVTSIELSAFYGCSGLRSITLSPSIETIGNYVFYGCTSLSEMRIPASVTSIGNYVFGSCTSLADIVLEDGDQTLAMGYGASQGEAYGLFRDCPLKSLYLGRTLSYTEKKDNGYSPFAYVGTLSKVTLSPNVKSMGFCLFYGTAISDIYIPSSVNTIHSSALNSCNNLKNVVILGATPPTTDSYNTLLYNSAENSKFYVFFPDNYKSAKVWKDYATKIEACCEVYSDFTYSGEGHVIGYKTDFPIVLDNRDTEAIDAGTYQKRIDVTYTTNGYSIKDVLKYEYTIKKAPLTITAESCSRDFGTKNPEFKLLYDGFVNDEDEKVFTKEPTVTTNATIDSPAGEYDLVVSGAEAKNYEISYVNGILTIVPAQQSVGDVNGDGEVNAKDVVDLVDYMSGMKSLAFSAVDVNGDGEVNSADVVMLSNLIMNK